ncbi:MAG: hypothetical protein IKF80_07685 [Erysipelotrichaceae bacterium]|nr:hypothetical protein [Erysipelotrichaceae bacterium]
MVKDYIYAMMKLNEAAKKKYGKQFYSSQVKYADVTKIVGKIETRDGKAHQLTVKW